MQRVCAAEQSRSRESQRRSAKSGTGALPHRRAATFTSTVRLAPHDYPITHEARSTAPEPACRQLYDGAPCAELLCRSAPEPCQHHPEGFPDQEAQRRADQSEGVSSVRGDAILMQSSVGGRARGWQDCVQACAAVVSSVGDGLESSTNRLLTFGSCIAARME